MQKDISNKFLPSFAFFLLALTTITHYGHALAAPVTPAAANSTTAFDGFPVSKSPLPLALAENGKALLPIVISPEATDGTKAVAAELADYLHQISGATFEIKTGTSQNGRLPDGIVLGSLTEFPIASLNEPLAIRDLYDGKEAFAIRSLPATGGGKLLLIGATDMGTSHAAYRFLELLGCRWFFMNPQWTVVPKIADLKFALNETTRPKVISRYIWFNYGSYDKDQADYKAWARHNRMAESLKVMYIHGYGSIIYDNMKEFEAHPEYYGLNSGKRVGWKMCLSNPEVRRMATAWALDYLKKYGGDMVTMEPPDGVWGWCECENCVKLGSLSDRAFGLANEVARAVQKTYPGKMVGLLAYSNHSDPPSFKLEPNVHVGLCNGYAEGKYTFEEKMALWPQYTDNRGMYEYLAMSDWGQDRIRPAPSNGLASSVPGLTARLREDIAWGMKSFQGESACNFAKFGPSYYVAMRVLWNPNANVQALMEDFYQKAFGPAAVVMKRYYERLDPASGRLFGEDLMARTYRDLNEASTLAQGRADVQARLDQLKQYLHYNYLQWKEIETTDNAEKKSLVLAKLTHVYRTRFSYMQHAVPVMYEAPEWAKTFNEPSWSSDNAPWKIDKPYTHEETEQLFQEELKQYQPQTYIERKFNEADLVPVSFAENYKPVPDAWAVFYAPKPYTVQSMKGEPIQVQACMSPDPEEHPVKYFLRDSKGKVVTQGECKTDPKLLTKIPLQLMPAAGQYELSPSSIYMNFSFAEGTPVVARLPREQGLDAYPATEPRRWYFYVPKGTHEISLYLSGYHLQFFDPEGKPAADLTKSLYQYKTISVPEGMDGKVWSIDGRIEVLVFLNLPNLVALSPDAFLLPRDVAVKDSLTIRQ